MTDIDLLAIKRGSVIAPAGCGKTELITKSLANYSGKKPILVLTHTNAGIAALRARFHRMNISSKAYRLYTIDGWAIRLISNFPVRSSFNHEILKLANPKEDYPNIRDTAAKLLESGHVNDVISASYEHLIVDEYQDCTISQHRLITNAANILPTCILGDPMQAIFGFDGDELPDWKKEVCTAFPVVTELDVPWRWINTNANALGDWLLEVRRKLQSGESINLREAPNGVRLFIGARDYYRLRIRVACISPPTADGSVLIIGDSSVAGRRHKLTSQTPGAVTVEPVDLPDLIRFSQEFDPSAPNVLEMLLGFASNIMVKVESAKLLKRVDSLRNGTAHKPPTEVEEAALNFVNNPSFRSAAQLLIKIRKKAGVRIYRPVLLNACIKAFKLSSEGSLSFYDAVLRVREEYRHVGRLLPRRAVGSTLLLKGLEADVVVVLDADNLDKRNLYVAITRGSRLLVICSRSPILNPKD